MAADLYFGSQLFLNELCIGFISREIHLISAMWYVKFGFAFYVGNGLTKSSGVFEGNQLM